MARSPKSVFKEVMMAIRNRFFILQLNVVPGLNKKQKAHSEFKGDLESRNGLISGCFPKLVGHQNLTLRQMLESMMNQSKQEKPAFELNSLIDSIFCLIVRFTELLKETFSNRRLTLLI